MQRDFSESGGPAPIRSRLGRRKRIHGCSPVERPPSIWWRKASYSTARLHGLHAQEGGDLWRMTGAKPTRLPIRLFKRRRPTPDRVVVGTAALLDERCVRPSRIARYHNRCSNRTASSRIPAILRSGWVPVASRAGSVAAVARLSPASSGAATGHGRFDVIDVLTIAAPWYAASW